MPPLFGEPVAVPASDGPSLELLDMWAAAVEPKLGGPLMKALAAAAPLTGLQHVKRVRKAGQHLEVLLCRADWKAHEQQQQKLQPQNQNGAAAAEQQEPGAPSERQLELPEAVAAIAQQYGLKPYIAKVRLGLPGRLYALPVLHIYGCLTGPLAPLSPLALRPPHSAACTGAAACAADA